MNKPRLWEEFRDSEEFQTYLKSEECKNLTEKLEKEKRLMVKRFDVKWQQNGTELVQPYETEKGAKAKALELNRNFGEIEITEMDGGKKVQQWVCSKGKFNVSFAKGEERAKDVAKLVPSAAAPINPKTPSVKETEMAKEKTAKKASKTGKKTGQAAAGPRKGKEQGAAKKASSKGAAKKDGNGATAPKVTGTIRDRFELREGSNKAKAVDWLLANKGKPRPTKELCKAVYGKAESGALGMVLNGIAAVIKKNKIPMKIEKVKVEKEPHIALQSV